MMAKNTVIAGDYINQDVVVVGKKFYFMQGLKKVAFEKADVFKHELVSNVSENPFWSTVARGCVGQMVFGPVGAIVGMASAPKGTEYLLSIEFNSGEKSLLSLDNKTYKSLIALIF